MENKYIIENTITGKKKLVGIVSIPKGTDKLIIPGDVDIIYSADCPEIDKKNIKRIIIEEGVTKITDHAFHNYENLEKVTFPTTLKYIDEYAFSGNTSLKELILPEKCKKIHKLAFYGQLNVERVYIPSTLTGNIDARYFLNKGWIPGGWTPKSNLKEITVSKDNPIYSDCDCNVIYNKKANELIKGCSNSIIPKETRTIRESAFENAQIQNVTLPNNLYLICNQAFENSSLEKIELNEGLTWIGDESFKNCLNLKLVIIPSTLKHIGNDAFENCRNIETIYINNYDSKLNLNYLDLYFYECNKIKNIYISNIENIDVTSPFYRKYKGIIKPLTLEMLINEGKSIKEANKILKISKEYEL